MTRTPNLDWAVDGVPMNDGLNRWFVLDDTTVYPDLSRLGINPSVMGADGALPAYTETYGVTLVTLKMAARATSHSTEDEAFMSLLNLFSKQGAPLTLQKTFRGRVATAAAKLNAITGTTRDVTGNDIYLSPIFTVPGVYFRDPNPLTWSQNPVSATTYEVVPLAGGGFPIKDALVRLTGPCGGGLLTDTQSSTQMSTPPLAAGQMCLIDCASGKAVRYTGTPTWDFNAIAGGVDVRPAVISTGLNSAFNLFTLTTRPIAIDPQVRKTFVNFQAASITTATLLEISARRNFL